MNRLLFLLILLAIASSQFQPLNATTYYVATNGSDSALGTSWAQAFQTISNAVAKASDYDTIIVSNGTYWITAQIVINKAITLRSLNGKNVTTIRRQGPAQHRILQCANSGAIVHGFTIMNGNSGNASGGGIYITGGTIHDCNIVSNTTVVGANAYGGGGIYIAGSCVISNCLIANCVSDRYAGGIYLTSADGIVTRCIISNNVNWIWGGGIYMTGGTVRDSLITRNTLTGNNGSYGGGGIWMSGGKVINCTVAGNFTYDQTPGAGILKSGGSVSNSIIYYNTKGTLANNISSASSVTYSCAPELTSGTGNITSDPDFVDAYKYDFRLLLTSPCIDKGINSAAGVIDLSGNPRVTDGDGNGTATVDMGCYETYAKNDGPLRCSFTASPVSGLVPVQAVFSSSIGGASTSGVVYCWDFENDGITNIKSASAWKITNSYTVAGQYDVRLVITNTSGQRAEFTRSQYIRASPSTIYLSLNGGHILPFDTWQKAATNINAAMAFQVNGLTIMVSNGVHVAKNITINTGTTIKSANGSPQTTIFRMPSGTGRVFEMTHPDAVIEGVSIRGGNTDFSGGGIYMLGGTVRNCIIESNQAPVDLRGGGGICVEGGPSKIQNCIIRKNYGMHYSGGIYLNTSLVTVENCMISNNSVYVWGAGIYMTGGIIRNCLICRNWLTMNHPSYGGGGVWMSGGRLENCTVVENTVGDSTPAGGVLKSGGAITNCIIYYNLKGVTANNLSSISGVQYSCAPELTSGTGNTSAEPEFADRTTKDYRLWPLSPCIDKGINIATVTNDLNGDTRPNDGDGDSIAKHDMGALEAPAKNENPFRCNFFASVREGMVPLSVVFTSSIAGASTAGTVYRWDFNNDGNFENPPGITTSTVVTNTFTVPALYTVRLVASNAVAGTCSRIKSSYILVFANQLFVSTNGSHTPPFTNWATSATNIAAVLPYTADGVTIWVSNGIYKTPCLQITKSITLKSVNGPNVTKIVRSSGSTPLLDVIAAGTTIDGFTVTGGNAPTYNGGGIRLFNGGYALNCIVTNNKADSSECGGGGIYIGGPGLIENCIIAKNTGYHYGGGIFVNNSQAVVNRCIISNNATFVWGGGIYLDGGTVRNTLVCKNYLTGDHPTYGGGGIRIWNGKLENCTIAENWVGSSTPGGGIRKDGGSITNCIIYFNRKGTSANNLSSTNLVRWSCAPELVTGQGNITADPQFFATNKNNYALMPGSPCINAGINMSWMTPGVLDVIGKPRKVQGTVDMGAYEFQPKPGLIIMLK